MRNGEKMKDPVTAFVFVRARFSNVNIARRLVRIPGVEEVHRVAGEDCYVVRVKTARIEDLDRLVRDKIERIKSVYSTKTTLILKTIKNQIGLSSRRSTASSAVRSGN